MHNFQPGDIVNYRWGIHSEPVSIVLLDIVEHESGALSIRYRFAVNRHRGIDWRGFVQAQDVPAMLKTGHDESVSLSPRSMLPA